MSSIYNLTYDELLNYLLDLGYKKFTADQIFDWLYKKRVSSFDEMTNLKKELITKLTEDFTIGLLELVKKEEDTGVKKYLFNLSDNNKIECVLMFHDYGNSLCISTELGCNMGCAFCESGRLKKVRNLNTYEIVEQILLIEKDINRKIDSVVIMGIGEPFDNYDNIIEFIKIINHAKGLQIGARHITVSTCGLIPKIKEFSNLNLQVNLAISLHASNDELRSKIMPINKAYPLKDLISTLKEYIAKTNRRVTIEYVMLKEVNDREENARELANLLKNMNVYVNLIPYNETSHIEYKRTNKEDIMKFYDVLKKNNINVTIRKEFGKGIDAACGQLRAKEVNKE